MAPAFNPNNYPRELLRALYLYVLEGAAVAPDSTALAQDFLTYVRDIPGQERLVEAGFISYLSAPEDIETELPEGFGPEGPDGRVKVCL